MAVTGMSSCVQRALQSWEELCSVTAEVEMAGNIAGGLPNERCRRLLLAEQACRGECLEDVLKEPKIK